MDPMSDQVFSVGEVALGHHEGKVNRDEFQSDLHDSVRGIKQLTHSLRSQVKVANPVDKGAQESIYKTKLKINELMNDFQQSLSEMADGFK